ncbi:MAG: AtpZ/AtpI family protein [Planctomycetota bacterium]|nr:AtpZ/AtpI family protein [Planctomycetota bacterium]
MALAMEWVAKITTVSLEMVLPGLFGDWLDGKFGTSFLVFIGFAIGLSGGLWHLLQMTKVANPPAAKDRTTRPKDPHRMD